MKIPAPYSSILGAVVLQVAVLVVAPHPLIQQGTNLVLTLWIAGAAGALTRSRRVFWVLLAVGWAPAILELAIPAGFTPLALSLAKDTLWAVFPFYVAYCLFKALFLSKQITHHELAGAVAVYLLLGLGFSDVFEIIYVLDPSSLYFGHTALEAAPQFTDFLYFSYVTLATLGYGDVAPVHPLARLTAVVEAVMGLMYVAIMVARLVSMHALGWDPPPGDAEGMR